MSVFYIPESFVDLLKVDKSESVMEEVNKLFLLDQNGFSLSSDTTNAGLFIMPKKRCLNEINRYAKSDPTLRLEPAISPAVTKAGSARCYSLYGERSSQSIGFSNFLGFDEKNGIVSDNIVTQAGY